MIERQEENLGACRCVGSPWRYRNRAARAVPSVAIRTSSTTTLRMTSGAASFRPNTGTTSSAWAALTTWPRQGPGLRRFVADALFRGTGGDDGICQDLAFAPAVVLERGAFLAPFSGSRLGFSFFGFERFRPLRAVLTPVPGVGPPSPTVQHSAPSDRRLLSTRARSLTIQITFETVIWRVHAYLSIARCCKNYG